MNELKRYLKSLGIPLSESEQEIRSQYHKYPDQVPFPNTMTLKNRYGKVYLLHETIPLELERDIDSCEIPIEIQKWLKLQSSTERLAIEDFLFIDVETSGEYGGVGVICFLVGIGRITKNELHLFQYLILHPEDEFSQLAELEKIFLSAKGIVTYNGKSFDLPLLQSRFQFHQIPLPTSDLLHIDLLHLSRRIWKNHLPSRTLRAMEATVLGIERSVNDIPGWMIPSIYRDYLLSQDASFLIPVLYHNKMDVYSLARLYLHIAGLFIHPMECTIENAGLIFRLANFYQSIGEITRAIDFYTACLPKLSDECHRLELLDSLGLLYKKQKQFEKAEETWKVAASLGSINAHLELAKYNERLKKDYLIARLWIESAIKLLEKKEMDRFERSKWKAELQFRLESLTKSKLP
ncbi:MAG: ribonuclease H-like domain-containing protein [Anaerolineales bacterium]|nr:ribonuclease H-like domain-containing protein [Anaerolineales bacterium]